MERLTRLHQLEEGLFKTVPFDPDSHTDGHEQVDGSYYPLETCYAAVESVLKADSYALLKTGLEAHFGDAGEILGASVTLIQWGTQQTIFRVQVRVRLGEEEREAAFIAGASRHPDAAEMVQIDHEVITQLRQVEAQAMGVDPESEVHKSAATFPRHYGGVKTAEGPFVYLTEFCEGYAELNLYCTEDPSLNFNGDITRRQVAINAINQGGMARLLDREESSEILAEVAMHQVLTAARCGLVLSPAFRAGDYMYHPEKKRVMLQCYRTPEFSTENGVWAKASEHLEFPGQDPRLVAVAFQLLGLSAHREKNLAAFNQKEAPNSQAFFTYSFMEMSRALGRLRREQELFRPEEWRMIAAIMQYLIQNLLLNFPILDEDKDAFLRQANSICMLVQFS